MRILKDKSGVSYVLVCAIVLIASMLIFIGMQYATALSAVSTHKSDTRLKLESCVMRSAIDNYDAIKQGNAYSDYIDPQTLVDNAYEALGFSWDTEYIEDNGKRMTRPEIEATENGGYGVKVTYELSVPFEFLDRTVTVITVPVEISAEYRER